ncbi:hypothetical protein B0T14DRAFT_518430 [Immersiella caudata]|uniref:DUF6594 domain-containing protein n=1 Tax=Immersiella caudata TaxID=314043 RepID=A0AA40BYW1_9PEZI|nr:hypothetical protein B0T14DRAFT_518430 [Immersiella caudata]
MDEAKRIVQYVRQSLDDEEEFHFLRFEFLQRLNIVQIQRDLIRLKSNISRENAVSIENSQVLEQRLKDYALAIKNYKDLRSKRAVPKREMRRRKLLLQRFLQSPATDFEDPFQSHYSFLEDEVDTKVDPLRRTLMRHLPVWFTYSPQEKGDRKKEYSEGKLPHAVSTPVDRLARLLIALISGSFLIAPMVIMSFDPSQTKSLVTVASAVLLFILVLSFGIRVSNIETMVATATYAAVLVVFVGTSNGSIGG